MVELEETRKFLSPGESPDYSVLLDTARELLSVIDNLTIVGCHHCDASGYFCVEATGEMVPCEYCGAVGKQVLQVKSYTEDELVDHFAKEKNIQLDETGNWYYEDWKAAQTLIENARFLGVLKTKGETKPMSTPQPRDPDLNNIIVRTEGKMFYCQCGGNVFHKESKDSMVYVCNSCETCYRGEV